MTSSSIVSSTKAWLLLLVFFSGVCKSQDTIIWDDEDDVDYIDSSLDYTGVNLAGGEFGVDHNGKGRLPGRFGADYVYPSPEDADYFLKHKMNTFRLPFRWERVQKQLYGKLKGADMQMIYKFVDHATEGGAVVVLDMHNYGHFNRTPIGSEMVPIDAFVDVWVKLAKRFRHNELVAFDLMNAPQGITSKIWVTAVNAAIYGIRTRSGASNLILVAGNGWGSAKDWNNDWYGKPNTIALLKVTDPCNNIAYSVQTFFDRESTGTGNCEGAYIGVSRLKLINEWLMFYNFTGWLTAFGTPASPECEQAVANTLKEMQRFNSVWKGWTWWAAGPMWGQYPLSIQPRQSTGKSTAQLDYLKPFVSKRPVKPVLKNHTQCAFYVHDEEDVDDNSVYFSIDATLPVTVAIVLFLVGISIGGFVYWYSRVDPDNLVDDIEFISDYGTITKDSIASECNLSDGGSGDEPGSIPVSENMEYGQVFTPRTTVGPALFRAPIPPSRTHLLMDTLEFEEQADYSYLDNLGYASDSSRGSRRKGSPKRFRSQSPYGRCGSSASSNAGYESSTEEKTPPNLETLDQLLSQLDTL